MANSVKFTINIDDNGSLQLVAKDAKKAASGIKGLGDATDKANKSRGKYQKQEIVGEVTEEEEITESKRK